MPTLLNDINFKILDFYNYNLCRCKSIKSEIKFEDYISLPGFIAYLQNFSKVVNLEEMKQPLTFGLINQYNTPIVNLEISY